MLYEKMIFLSSGITAFHQFSINDLETSGSDPEDTQSMKSGRSGVSVSSVRSGLSVSGTSVLDGYVGQVREALGIESHLTSSR